MSIQTQGLPGFRPQVSVEEGLRHLLDASRAVLSILETERLLAVLMDRAITLTRAERGFLMLAGEDGELRLHTGRGFQSNQLETEGSAISRSVAEEVHRTGRPILTANALGDEALRRRRSVLDLQLQTVMCAPLRGPQGVSGVLYVDSSHVRSTFDSHTFALFEALADLAAIALANARLFELATTDPKTRLANSGFFRTRLDQALEEASRSQTHLALLLIDLDHFKRINDTWGHPAGDRVLVEVASILKRSVRSADVAARFGGEEFAVLLCQTSKESAFEPQRAAERIRRRMAACPVVLSDGQAIRFTASLGLVISAEGAPHRADELIETSDRCLYEAKHRGRDCLVTTRLDTAGSPVDS